MIGRALVGRDSVEPQGSLVGSAQRRPTNRIQLMGTMEDRIESGGRRQTQCFERQNSAFRVHVPGTRRERRILPTLANLSPRRG